MSEIPEGRQGYKHAEAYAWSLTLIQYEIQRLWIIFSAFLLAETVLLSGVAQVFVQKAFPLALGGSLLGLTLIIPWWATFENTRCFYLLRVNQAKSLEQGPVMFFNEGAKLYDKDKNNREVRDVKMAYLYRFMRPQRAARVLMGLFFLASAFAAVIKLKNPQVAPLHFDCGIVMSHPNQSRQPGLTTRSTRTQQRVAAVLYLGGASSSPLILQPAAGPVNFRSLGRGHQVFVRCISQAPKSAARFSSSHRQHRGHSQHQTSSSRPNQAFNPDPAASCRRALSWRCILVSVHPPARCWAG